ncbi:MAG: DUF7594 domain-containing protein [Actinomycetota bacterium]
MRLRIAASRMLALVILVTSSFVWPQGSVQDATAAPPTDVFTFGPEADAYVDSAQPSTSFGASRYLWVDASSVKRSFLRFQLTGLNGRTLTSVRLRLYQTDASPLGGSVWSMSSNAWDESVTWQTRPAIDGSLLGSFESVQPSTWYELGLDQSLITGDGPLSLAMDSSHSDGARWGSREHARPPQLVVEAVPIESDSFSFVPEADTYVDSSRPASSFGTSSSLYADASPVKQSFLRFRVAGIEGRTVTRVRLRLYQTDSSPLGGRVHSITSNIWTELMTWETRPAVDGPLLGVFGTVASGRWYEANLGSSAVASDGPLSLAILSTSSNGARWGSGQHAEFPQLVVDVSRVPGLTLDGLSQVAAPYFGSSDPTYFAANRRLALTEGGRMLAVFGRHSRGVQLAWRDPGGGWMTRTIGAVGNGLLLGGSGTGDWPASIAVARDSAGRQHAWAVWSGSNSQSGASVMLRRLSDLDSAEGPTVGPIVVVPSAGIGNSKVDLAFESAPDGSLRGCIAWLQRIDASSWNVAVTWFTDLDADQPVFHDGAVIFNSSSGARMATLVPVTDGLRMIVRGPTGRLQVFGHDASAPLANWWAWGSGIKVSGSSVPGGVALGSGEVLAPVEGDTSAHVVTVQRFSADGVQVATDLRLTGYSQPSIAGDGTDAWLVMIRRSDGYVVSRRFTAGSGWDGADRVEIGPEGGGNLAWPNVLRDAEGRLRLLVRGPSGGTNRNAVLAYQRPA